MPNNPFEYHLERSHIGKPESKIERGLRNFMVYRAGYPQTLLRHFSRITGTEETLPSNKVLDRAIFFTTQKNMAMEYSGEKHVLMKIRGWDFLEDLRRVPEGIRIILLSHDDLVTYQRVLDHQIGSPEAVENFFRQHTFPVRDISPRSLRGTAEIIVLLPLGLDKLPLRQKNIKYVPYPRTSLRGYPPQGQFHELRKRVELKLEGKYKQRRLYRKRLERELALVHAELDSLQSRFRMIQRPAVRERIEELRKREGDLARKLFDLTNKYFSSIPRENVPRDKQEPRSTAKRRAIGESEDS